MNTKVLASSVIAALALIAVLMYLHTEDQASSPASTTQNTERPPASTDRSEESVVKEMLIEYAHAMLLAAAGDPDSLFTKEYIENVRSDGPLLQRVSSAQMGQPDITFVSSDFARVRFELFTRSGSDLLHTHERMVLKRVPIKGWRIDKRSSQPVMASSTSARGISQDSSFLFIKSEDEQARDLRMINELIQYWRDARTETDLEAILSVYEEDIWREKGLTREEWLEEFRNPRKITISNVSIVFPKQALAEVSLNENTEELNTQAHYDVHLTLRLSDDGWIIANEESKTISETLIAPITQPASIDTVASRTDQDVPGPDTSADTDVRIDTTLISEPRTAATASQIDDVKNLISAWRTAWATQDVGAYLSFYSKTFKPKSGMNLDRWRDYRRIRLTRPKSIDVQIQDVQVVFESQNRVKAVFHQRYKSNTYEDETKKTLTLVREGSEWKIVGEHTKPL